MCLAIPGEILQVDGQGFERRGRVLFGGIEKSVSLALTPEADVGQFVLVHAGVAITTIDAAAAERVFQALADLDAAEEAEEGA